MDAGFSEQDAREGSEEGFNVWLAARNVADQSQMFGATMEICCCFPLEHDGDKIETMTMKSRR
eukprot:3010291-Rhodomonas_salina.1